MDNENVLRKIKKIKALAEKGVDGERETAIRMYYNLIQSFRNRNRRRNYYGALV